MGFNPGDAINSAKDIAVYAVEMSGDIVENAVQIVKGNVTEGVSNIVQDSLDIAGYSVEKVKEMVTGRGGEAE